ncbi:MAG: DHA2 family efflux MFS transporter permease subunit [Nocardioides sp.]|nr:DHA2 family efflux MFS transporter permease subunit [Nocardioides sp.]
MTVTEDVQAPEQILDRRRMNLVFLTVMGGMLLAALDQTIVSTALPTIVGDLGGANHLSWVVSAYLLTDTIATVLAGKFGDLFGRKLVFQISAGSFVIASGACGFAQNMGWLIAWRAVQGLGAGGLMVTATAVIADVIPLRERGKYQGALGAVFGVTTVLGPLLGGLFTDHLSWRWAFYVNLPIGIAVVILAAATMPHILTTARPAIDYLGAVFISLGAGCLTLAVSWGGTEYAWGSATIIALFVVSLVSLGVFVWAESRATDPILPLRLFKSSVFTISVILAFIVGFAMLGAMTFLPTFLQYVDGVSATVSGLQTLPLVVGLLITSIASGTIIGKTGRYRWFPIAGTLLMALGLWLLSRMTATTGWGLRSFYMLVLGFGIGLSMQVLTIIVQNTAAYRDLGVATSGVTFFRTLGSSFGASIFGTVYANVLSNHLPAAYAASPGVDPTKTTTPEGLHSYPADQIRPILDAYAHAVHVVFLTAVPVALLAFALAWFLKEVPLRGSTRAGATDVGDGFGMPEDSDRVRRLELAIGRLTQRADRDDMVAMWRDAGTTLAVADAWCLAQVRLHNQVGVPPTLVRIAGRVHVPPEVLAPAFATALHRGFLVEHENVLALTDSGAREIIRLADARRRWLARELSDWGAEDDALLAEALDNVSRRLLDESTPEELEPIGA